MPDYTSISALRPDTSGHDLLVKVLDQKTVIDRPTRSGGKPTKIVECLVGDNTGTIIFSARNDQVELMKPGTYLSILNAKVDMVRGNMRVTVNANGGGKIESATADITPRVDLNMSLIEYELVPVP